MKSVLFRGAILALACGLVPLHAEGQAANAQTPAIQPPSPLDPDLKNAIRLAATATPDSDGKSSQSDKEDYVRLLDLGDTTVLADGTTRSVYRVAYRINSARARGLGEVTLPFNGSYETVKVLRARTIRKDGTSVVVKPEEIRSTSPGSDYLMYDDAQASGFRCPPSETAVFSIIPSRKPPSRNFCLVNSGRTGASTASRPSLSAATD